MTKSEWYIIGKKGFIKEVDRIIKIYQNRLDYKINYLKLRKILYDKAKSIDKEAMSKFETDFEKELSEEINRLKKQCEQSINKLKNQYKLKFAGIVGLSAIALLAIGLFAKYIHKKRKEMKAKLELEKERMEKENKSKVTNESVITENRIKDTANKIYEFIVRYSPRDKEKIKLIKQKYNSIISKCFNSGLKDNDEALCTLKADIWYNKSMISLLKNSKDEICKNNIDKVKCNIWIDKHIISYEKELKSHIEELKMRISNQKRS